MAPHNEPALVLHRSAPFSNYANELKAKHPLVRPSCNSLGNPVYDLVHTDGSMPTAPWTDNAGGMGSWCKVVEGEDGKLSPMFNATVSDSVISTFQDVKYGEDPDFHEPDTDDDEPDELEIMPLDWATIAPTVATQPEETQEPDEGGIAF